MDAQEAARAVLSGRAHSQAKAGDGPVQCARLFKLAKDSAVKARTQAINQLKAVLVAADPDLREQLAGLKNPALIRACAQFGDHESGDGETDAVEQATRITLCLLAQRIDQLTGQIRGLERRLTELMDHHRLNRGGDRRANAALYRIVQTGLRFDARTRNYYERRLAEGKTRRETIRCLKRHAAREVFHLVRSGLAPCEVAQSG